MPYNSVILCPQCGADVTRTPRNECPRCDFREIIASPPDEQTTLADLAESIMNEQPAEGRGGGSIYDQIVTITDQVISGNWSREHTSGEMRWLRLRNRTEPVLQQKWVTTQYRAGLAPFNVAEEWRDVPMVDE